MPGDEGPEEALEAPVCHHGSASERTPLVWVGDAAPASSDLMARIAGHVGGTPHGPREVSGSTGAFGARQRGWLTRLTWEPSTPRERRLVRSASFLDAERLQELAGRMPEDAIHIPADADAIVDGLTPAGEVMFYALFEGPTPWRPIPLMPVAPPFNGLKCPHLLGDVPGRLRSWASEFGGPPLDDTAVELVRAALRVVEADTG